MGIARTIVRAVVPKWLRHKIFARRHAREFYRFYFKDKVDMIRPKLEQNLETTNFTYDLTEQNLHYLAATISCATGAPFDTVEAYINEAVEDEELNEIAATAWHSPTPWIRSPFARRLGWYAIARIIKPRVIMETGVDRGHGALILCAALLRNADENKPGRYYGTDINPKAGGLLKGKYAPVGKFLYGDSIQSLEAFAEPIDLFVNDSDHSADYEYREYLAIKQKLSGGAFILGDNSHVTDKLARFSRETGRRFLFFREYPDQHWYPGGGIGISFPQK